MEDYKSGDNIEVEFMTTTPGGYKRYFKWQAEVILIRKKYFVIEDENENGFVVLKSSVKNVKKIKFPKC